MNKREFSVYLQKPHLIDKHAEIALQEVVTDFPYFHAAHQLLLKAHQNNGSYHFDKQLPITSLLHGNRALLYAYLKDSLVREYEYHVQNDPVIAGEALNEVEYAKQESIPFLHEIELEKLKEEDLDVFVEKEPGLPIEMDISVAVEPENVSSKIARDLRYPDSTEKNSREREEELNNKTSMPSDQELESIAPDEAIVAVARDDEPELEDKIEIDEIVAISQIPVDEAEIGEDPLEQEKVPDTSEVEKVIAGIEPHDFLSWLQANKSKHTQELRKEVGREEPKSIGEEQVDSPNKPGAEKRIRKFNSLIDKFIETSPSISKPQPTKFYNPAQKAKESVIENFDLVTETLARIYIKQNNYKKAILVYEKLILLYPEKKSYFTDLISDLQILINK